MATVVQKTENGTGSRSQIGEERLGMGYMRKLSGNWSERTTRRVPTHIRRRWDSVFLERRRLTEAVDQPPAASSQIGYVAVLAGDLGDGTGLYCETKLRTGEPKQTQNVQLSLGG